MSCSIHGRERELNAVACSVRKDSPDSFALLIASAETKPKEVHEFKIGDRHAKLSVEYGDFSDALKKAADALAEVSTGFVDRIRVARLTSTAQAKKYAANDHQAAFLEKYIES